MDWRMKISILLVVGSIGLGTVVSIWLNTPKPPIRGLARSILEDLADGGEWKNYYGVRWAWEAPGFPTLYVLPTSVSILGEREDVFNSSEQVALRNAFKAYYNRRIEARAAAPAFRSQVP